MPGIRVGISSCLLGHPVRFDGRHKLAPRLREALGAFVTWVPVCPEVECGLQVPREPLRLVGDTARPRLVGVNTRVDHTERMAAWAARRIDELEREQLCGFVFKSRSPSSGLRRIEVFAEGGWVASADGVGLFARAFTERFPLLPVEDEEGLRDRAAHERFLERMIAGARRAGRLPPAGAFSGRPAFPPPIPGRGR